MSQEIVIGPTFLNDATSAESAEQDGPLDIILGEGLYLSRTISVPQQARKKLHSFLELNLRQAMPDQVAVLIWDFQQNPDQS